MLRIASSHWATVVLEGASPSPSAPSGGSPEAAAEVAVRLLPPLTCEAASPCAR